MDQVQNYNPNIFDVAAFIRRARETTRLTQEEFTRQLDTSEPVALRINRVTLSKYENGVIVPPADKFLKIMHVARRIGAASV